MANLPTPERIWHHWNPDPWVLALLALALLLYAAGLWRLRRRAGHYGATARRQSLCYGSGLLLLGIALASPLAPLGSALSAAHMVQHMLLFFAAPFLILGAPLARFLWALPRGRRRGLGKLASVPRFAGVWNRLTAPPSAWTLYALTLWFWHTPGPYQLALAVPLVHHLEHLSFILTALLLWWAVFRRASYGGGVALLFTTMLHSGLLAALMTFSARPWYPVYGETAPLWGLTPLEDQQIAGLLMWIPGSIAYLLAGLSLTAVGLSRMEKSATRTQKPGSKLT